MRASPRTSVLLTCLAGCVLFVGCSLVHARQPKSPQLITLKVNAPAFLSLAPLFIAQKEGYFAQQGLQVEFTNLFTAEAIPALGQGKLDVAAGLIPINVLNSIARGANIKVVSDMGYLDPTNCAADAVVARRAVTDSGRLTDAATLRGLRASIERASAEEYIVDKLLSTVGLTLDDLDLVEIPIPSELEALKDGGVDIVPTSEPWVTRMVESGYGTGWLPFQAIVPGFQYLVLYYGPTLIEEDRELGQRFMVACLEGVRQFRRGKTERNVEILTKYTGLDRELVKQACWARPRHDGQINVQSVLDYQAWAVQKQYMDAVVPEEQFWDPSFVAHANEVLAE